MNGFRIVACLIWLAGSGMAQAQSTETVMLPRTADAADGMLFANSVMQGHVVDVCKRLDPESAPQLEAAHRQWLQDRTGRLRNGRAYSLKVFEKRGSSEQKASDATKADVLARVEPLIAADAKARCTALLTSIESDFLSKDAVLPVPTRGGTLASPTLSQDVYKKAQAFASCANAESVELLILERTPTLIRERWTLHGCGKAAPMLVTFTPGPTAETTRFTISPDTGAEPTAGK